MSSNHLILVLSLCAIVILILTADHALAHQCYACGAHEKSGCDHFDPSNSIYIKECPPDSKGCSTQTHGNTVTRSCEYPQLDDCKTANGVEYCYCSRNLCNGIDATFTDDEDLVDQGSGSGPVKSGNKHAPNNVSSIANLSSNVQIYLSKTYVMVVLLLCN